MYPPNTKLIFTHNGNAIYSENMSYETPEYGQKKIDKYLSEIKERGIIKPDDIVIYLQYPSKYKKEV